MSYRHGCAAALGRHHRGEALQPVAQAHLAQVLPPHVERRVAAEQAAREADEAPAGGGDEQPPVAEGEEPALHRVRLQFVGRHLRDVDFRVGHGHGAPERTKFPLEELVEPTLHLSEIGIDRLLQRRIGVDSGRV